MTRAVIVSLVSCAALWCVCTASAAPPGAVEASKAATAETDGGIQVPEVGKCGELAKAPGCDKAFHACGISFELCGDPDLNAHGDGVRLWLDGPVPKHGKLGCVAQWRRPRGPFGLEAPAHRAKTAPTVDVGLRETNELGMRWNHGGVSTTSRCEVIAADACKLEVHVRCELERHEENTSQTNRWEGEVWRASAPPAR